MSQHFSPKTVSNGLIYCSDPGNSKSFRGIGATNLANGIYYGYSNSNTATFKYQQGTEKVYIPAIGWRTATTCYIYNDYNGGSGQCCPFIFSFGGFNVSPSTTYTYAIIYKTLTGYTNANYMYRYEATSGNVYVTEGGVHSNSNRISLGDNWWYAWGQFTTAATTGKISSTPMAHYEYATNNTVYVAAVSITQGTYIHDPRYLVPLNTTRADTVAGGGGMFDVSGGGCDGTLTNGPTYSGANGGIIVMDGTNDYLEVSNVPDLSVYNKFTASIWIKSGTATWNEYGWIMSKRDQFIIHPTLGTQGISLYVNCTSIGWTSIGYTPNDITKWNQYAMSFNAGVLKSYLNGQLIQTQSLASAQLSSDTGVMTIGRDDGLARYGNGSVSCAMLYSRDLSDAEMMQNYNAQKSRFGV